MKIGVISEGDRRAGVSQKRGFRFLKKIILIDF